MTSFNGFDTGQASTKKAVRKCSGQISPRQFVQLYDEQAKKSAKNFSRAMSSTTFTQNQSKKKDSNEESPEVWQEYSEEEEEMVLNIQEYRYQRTNNLSEEVDDQANDAINYKMTLLHPESSVQGPDLACKVCSVRIELESELGKCTQCGKIVCAKCMTKKLNNNPVCDICHYKAKNYKSV